MGHDTKPKRKGKMGWALLISSSFQHVFILSDAKATREGQECMCERKREKPYKTAVKKV